MSVCCQRLHYSSEYFILCDFKCLSSDFSVQLCPIYWTVTCFSLPLFITILLRYWHDVTSPFFPWFLTKTSQSSLTCPCSPVIPQNIPFLGFWSIVPFKGNLSQLLLSLFFLSHFENKQWSSSLHISITTCSFKDNTVFDTTQLTQFKEFFHH